jgi:predicted alpha/beta hydrolase family esterase
VLAVAHSFGCLATVQALTVLGAPIAATLLVAPADPDRFGIDPTWLRSPLPGVHRMVISDNDPWLTPARAGELGRAWQVSQVSLGNAGHINVASGFGAWPQGDAFLVKLLARFIDRSAPGEPLPPTHSQSPSPSRLARQGIAL